jgi:hypothetical protein
VAAGWGHRRARPSCAMLPRRRRPTLLLLLLLLLAATAARPASAEWKLLFRQTAGLWQDAAKWTTVSSAAPSGPNYSVLDTVSPAMKGADGYTLKLKYPQGADGKPMDGENVWTQTDSPTTTTGCDKSCPGYTSISNTWGCGFSGIQKCSCSKDQALLCNTNKANDWWFALGTAKAWKGDTFPGPCHKTVKQVELWICVNSKDACVTVGEELTGGAGWGIPFLLWGGLAALSYMGVGLVVGKIRRRRGSAPPSAQGGGRGGLAAHPHYPHWMEIRALVMDGIQYARSRGRGRVGMGQGLVSEADRGQRRSSSTSRHSVSSVGSGKSSKSAKSAKSSTAKKGSKRHSGNGKKDSKAARRKSSSSRAPVGEETSAPASPPPVNLGRQETEMTDAFGNTLRR